jgi:ribose/xylose/arabinose/galactoside ABC-type transport system permease subunit
MSKAKAPMSEFLLEKVVLANKAGLFALSFAIFLSFASPYFLTSSNVFSLLDQVVVFTVVALAATYLLGAGEIDLSIIGIVPLAGSVMAKLMVDGGWPPVAAVAAGIGVGAACGLVNAGMIALFSLPSFIVTLATGAVFQGVNYVITNLISISGLPDGFVTIGQGRLGQLSYPVLVMIPIVAVFIASGRTTVFAQHVVAMANSPQAVRAAGISTNRMRLKLFLLMGVCSGLAAVFLTARSASAQPTAGANLLLLVIAAVVIGGTPITGGRISIVGTLFGSLTIGMISNGLNLIGVNPNYSVAIQGAVILLALYVDAQTSKLSTRLAKRALQREWTAVA